jgi:pimeloyl-ACP methyl ester carboxylesterase
MKHESATVTSKDGTVIAYDRSGSGPGLILVSAALSDRTDTAKLGRLLSDDFTVIQYDRRGRGASSDTSPYSISREVEDIEALLEVAGGSGYLFGSSSGSVLALEAASRLGDKVHGLFMYEPPFIIDNGRAPMPEGFSGQIEALVLRGRRGDAVKLFFTHGMGISAVFVQLMRWLMPGWSKMVGMAHTIPYDLALLAGTQTGGALPVERWVSNSAPTLVMVGGKSEEYFHVGARALAGALPDAQYLYLAGCNHGAVVMAPKAIAAAISRFCSVNRAGDGAPSTRLYGSQ